MFKDDNPAIATNEINHPIEGRLLLKKLEGDSEKTLTTTFSSSNPVSPIVDDLIASRGGTYYNEKWETSYLLSGRVNAINEHLVTCETIINKDESEVQMRNYPIKMFQHLQLLQVGKTFKIKINEKAGAFRIDIFDGSNLGIEKEFERLVNWDTLNDIVMDNPLEQDD